MFALALLRKAFYQEAARPVPLPAPEKDEAERSYYRADAIRPLKLLGHGHCWAKVAQQHVSLNQRARKVDYRVRGTIIGAPCRPSKRGAGIFQIHGLTDAAGAALIRLVGEVMFMGDIPALLTELLSLRSLPDMMKMTGNVIERLSDQGGMAEPLGQFPGPPSPCQPFKRLERTRQVII